MKILDVQPLRFPEVKIIRFERFRDDRGYFTETYRAKDMRERSVFSFLSGVDFVQSNESFSRKGTVRGLHFQWDPPMGKLVRPIFGHMVDMFLDIRKDSPSFGKILAYDMPARQEAPWAEWIWVPPGFAHGNFFLEDSVIQYLCTAEYNPVAESGISPLSTDLDWSWCDANLKKSFENLVAASPLISAKDRAAVSLKGWTKHPLFSNFLWRDFAKNHQ